MFSKRNIAAGIVTIVVFALVVFILLSASSCKKSETGEFAVIVPKTTVSASAGSYFVTVKCSDPWRLSLSFSDANTAWATISPTSGSGNEDRILLEYEANESEASRSLTVVLTSSHRETTCNFTQSGVGGDFSSGNENEGDGGDESGNDGGNGDEGDEDGNENTGIESTDVPKWLELPAVYDDDGLTFYTHPMTIDNTVTRNYSFYWDKGNHLSHWVAYPLNDWLKGSGTRSNAWAYDPLVPKEEQANLTSSYKGDYDRGHQIPSADRYQGTSNRETFYFTNMTPQESWFNQQIWTTLEDDVRNWASQSDTLYVVTGCVIDGYTSATTDASGMDCPIPLAYYKVVLRYSKASTLGFSGYMGAAFYLEHKKYSDKNIYTSMMMSIDDIEEMLGIDFFVNLPDVIGESAAANVEKQDPVTVSTWWGIPEG